MHKIFKLKYLLPLASASLIGNGYMLYERYQESASPQKAILNAFKRFQRTPNPQQTFAAVAVQAANRTNITMYGKNLVDEITDPAFMVGRRQYEVHPYRKAGAGTNIIPLYRDSTGNTHVLLGRKYLNPRDKQLGLANSYILLGGYMQPHPLETSATQAIKDLDGDEKDFIEEDLLRGGSGYSKKLPQTMQVLSKKTAEFDIDLKATAIRELAEEAGLSASDAKEIYSAGVYSTYPYTNDPRLHTIVEDYVFDFGTEKPVAVAGSDIAEVRWVNVNNITRDLSDISKKDQAVRSNDISRYSIKMDDKSFILRDRDGEALDNALQVYEARKKTIPKI